MLNEVFRGEIAAHRLRHLGFVSVAMGHEPAAHRRHYFICVEDFFFIETNNGGTFFVDAFNYFHNIDIVFFFHFYNCVNVSQIFDVLNDGPALVQIPTTFFVQKYCVSSFCLAIIMPLPQ